MHAPGFLPLAVAAAVLAPGVPAFAQKALAIGLNLNGLSHFLNTAPAARPYVSMGYGTVSPFGSASYALTGDVDPSGAAGLKGVLTVSLSGGSGFEVSFELSSFSPAPEGRATVVTTTGQISNGMGDLAGAGGSIAMRISVLPTADAADLTLTGNGNLTMDAYTGGPLSITTSVLPDATQNLPYAQSLKANGGTPPYSLWEVIAGSLPAGIEINQRGVISGIPNMPGTSTITIQVSDHTGATTTKAFSIGVRSMPPPVSVDSTIQLNSQNMAVCGGSTSGSATSTCSGAYTTSDSANGTGALTYSAASSSDYGTIKLCQALSVGGASAAVLPATFTTRASFRDQLTIQPAASASLSSISAKNANRTLAEDAAEVEMEVSVDGQVVAAPVDVPSSEPDPGTASCSQFSESLRSGVAGILTGLTPDLSTLGGALGNTYLQIGSLTSVFGVSFPLTFPPDPKTLPTTLDQLIQAIQQEVKVIVPVSSTSTATPVQVDFELTTVLGGSVEQTLTKLLNDPKVSSDPAMMDRVNKLLEAASAAMAAGHHARLSIIQNMGRTVKVTSVLVKDKNGNPISNVRVVGQSGTLYPMDPRNVPPSPVITSDGVTNGASNLAGPVAPGEIVVLYGSGLGPTSLVGLGLDSFGKVGTSISTTQVLFDGIASPMIYSQAQQVAAVVPYGINSGSTVLQLSFEGRPSAALTLPVSTSAPGLFTADSSGTGQGAILNQDGGTGNNSAHPAPRNSVVTLFATGEGATDPAGVDGALAAPPLTKPLLPVSVSINGIPAMVEYAGGAPGLVAGVLQVNVRIPDSVPDGDLPVVLKIGDAASQPGVTVAVR